jgi:hypothetical protein
LVAQELAADVIKKLVRFSLFLIIFLSFQNCAVDLNSSTPGAASVSCSPSAQTLQTFLPIMTGTLQNTGNVGTKQGCANCHISGTGAGSFKILTGTTADVVLANFCSSQSRKARLGVHPTESSHQQVYSASDIANLINWISTLN